jgi:divalent metal cation (Fe/Co/Zn/Cd) transporter
LTSLTQDQSIHPPSLSRKQAASREKTLLVAFLLSVWAPLTTGMAVLMSHSTTQVADFIRRTVELVALFISWQVFRYIEGGKSSRHLGEEVRGKAEKVASLSVAAALGCSGLVMLGVALARLSSFQPGGNVLLGLAIACLGLITNAWFWQRYRRMTREHYNPVIASQVSLYRAKAIVDLCVILALSSVAISPAHPVTRYIDLLGSVTVAFYLLWSSLRSFRSLQPPPSRYSTP